MEYIRDVHALIRRLTRYLYARCRRSALRLVRDVLARSVNLAAEVDQSQLWLSGNAPADFVSRLLHAAGLL